MEDRRVQLQSQFFNYPSLSFYIHFAFQVAKLGVDFLSGEVGSLADFRRLLSTDLASLVLLGRGVTVLFDVGTVLLAYLLGKRVGGQRCALLAAFFLAFSALHVEHAQVITVDVPLTFFAVLSSLLLLDVLKRGRLADYVGSGLCIGLATATKYPAALLVVPLLVASLPQLARRLDRRGALGKLGLSLLLSLLVFLLVNPFIVLDFKAFIADIGFERTHMAIGHFGQTQEISSARFYATTFWGAAGVAAAAALIALYQTVRMRDRQRALLFLWVVLYVATVSTWEMRANRYLLPIFPIVLVLGASAIEQIFSRIGRPAPRRVALVVAAAVYLLPQGSLLRGHYDAASTPDTRTQVRLWVEENVAPNSLLAIEPYSYPVRDVPSHPYLIMVMPFSSVSPEGISGFYDLRWYANFDYVVISSAVYQRYVDRARDFAMQMKFYSDLEEHWRDVAWLGSKGQSGPTIAIYQNPASERPDTEFAQDLYHGLSDMSGSATDFFLGRLAHLCMRAGYETRASGVVQELSRIKGMSGARPGTAASFYHTYAATELARGDKASALAAFRKSVELGSDNARTYLLLTNLLLEARRPEEARPILRRIVEADLSGTDSETYAEVGRILRGMREMAASTTAYRKALVLDPDAVSARVNLGWDLFIGGSYDGAVTEYLLALETEANSTAQFRLGLAYLAKGDVANARAAYSRGVAVHGADEGRRVGAADDLQRLASLGKHAAEAREILETYWSDGAR